MLGQVNPTPFDLYFPLFGIQVRVTPWFWLAGVLMGFQLFRDQQYDLLLIWIACVFVSILIHEMGHALAGKMFGWPSDVVLYHFGGVTRYYHQVGFTTGRSVVVTFAGPWAGFVFYGVVVGVEYLLKQNGTFLNLQAQNAIHFLKFLNLYWGLVNLLPVFPLDGGQISQALFEHYNPRNGLAWCLRIGAIVGGITAVLFYRAGFQFAAILFALLAIDNFQRLEQSRGGW